jgi:hypothetical protein
MYSPVLVVGIVLLVLWLLGFLSSYTMGGLIYAALVVGLILVVVSLVMRPGRRHLR